MEENEQLHVPSNAWGGVIMGKAASFCLIFSVKTANKSRLPVKAQLVAVSAAFEKNKIKQFVLAKG